jgi:hypothetical protein
MSASGIEAQDDFIPLADTSGTTAPATTKSPAKGKRSAPATASANAAKKKGAASKTAENGNKKRKRDQVKKEVKEKPPGEIVPPEDEQEEIKELIEDENGEMKLVPLDEAKKDKNKSKNKNKKRRKTGSAAAEENAEGENGETGDATAKKNKKKGKKDQMEEEEEGPKKRYILFLGKCLVSSIFRCDFI